MKTKNNVQKAITKSLAVIISLVLLSITVQAQEFWESVWSNNSINKIAMAMVSDSEKYSTEVKSGKTDNSITYARYFAEEAEKNLQLEDWMVNDNLFNVNTNWFKVETEAALQLEDWMMNQDLFNVKTVEISNETEAPLLMEDWMTNTKIWKI